MMVRFHHCGRRHVFRGRGGHGLFVVIGWVDVVEREGWGSWSVCALLRLSVGCTICSQ